MPGPFKKELQGRGNSPSSSASEELSKIFSTSRRNVLVGSSASVEVGERGENVGSLLRELGEISGELGEMPRPRVLGGNVGSSASVDVRELGEVSGELEHAMGSVDVRELGEMSGELEQAMGEMVGERPPPSSLGGTPTTFAHCA